MRARTYDLAVVWPKKAAPADSLDLLSRRRVPCNGSASQAGPNHKGAIADVSESVCGQSKSGIFSATSHSQHRELDKTQPRTKEISIHFGRWCRYSCHEVLRRWGSVWQRLWCRTTSAIAMCNVRATEPFLHDSAQLREVRCLQTR